MDWPCRRVVGRAAVRAVLMLDLLVELPVYLRPHRFRGDCVMWTIPANQVARWDVGLRVGGALFVPPPVLRLHALGTSVVGHQPVS